MKTLSFLFVLFVPLGAFGQAVTMDRLYDPAKPSPSSTSVASPGGWIDITPAGIGAATASQGAKADTAVQTVPAQTWTSITGKPTLFSGSYPDLANRPTLFDGTWASVTGKPTTLAGYGITDASSSSPSRLSTSGNAPTLAMAAAAGSGASATISGTNLAGTITMITGVSLLSTGAVMTLTFADGFSFPNGCAVLFSPANANFASVYTKLYAAPIVTGGRCTGATINTALSLSISTAYAGTYIVIGW